MAAMVDRSGIFSVIVRVAFTAVFVVNVQCALSFVFAPEQFVGGFMLQGTGQVGTAAVAGLGIAFLMWNATYPAFIVAPSRFPVLGWVVLAQQLIGLVGEMCLVAALGPELETLRASLLRFVAFDAAGLVVMAVSFALFIRSSRKDDIL